MPDQDVPASESAPIVNAAFGDDWWRQGVVYQVYPRSFADTNGDGFGDLPGIIDRLDFLADLGVDAVWLSPIYPSPGLDVGYDVSDHESVDPLFGTEADFDRLVAEAHGRGIRVILDLVMNHTSDEHAWFQASRASREGPFADWYLWRDPSGHDADGRPLPPNNWVSWFGGSAWEWEEARGQFYMHTFLVEQPDLNWRQPEVEAAQFRMVRGWLDRGVDGFRLDVFNAFLKHPDLLDNPVVEGTTPSSRQTHLYDRDQPDFAELIARFRAIVDEQTGRMSVGELFSSDPHLAVALATDRHPVFEWILLSTPWSAEAFGTAIRSREEMFGAEKWPANVLSNHDQSRQATRLARSAGIADVDGVARAAAVVLLTIRGTAYLYYGEELGLQDVPVADDAIIDPPARRALVDPDFPWWNRDLCRSPMPWTGDAPGFGFTTGRPWLPFGGDATTRNVAAEVPDPGSVLSTYRRMLALRRRSVALRSGALRLAGAVGDVLAWYREVPGERLLIVVNFADESRVFELPGGSGETLRAIGGSHPDPSGPGDGPVLALRPLEAIILEVG